MVFGLAYSSRAQTAFDDQQLEDLANAAGAKNQQMNITGYLYYRDGLFMQYLEGEQEKVEALMGKIIADERHHVFSTIILPKIKKRVFPYWYMRFLSSDLPHTQAPTLEDELAFILETSAQENYSSTEVADAIQHVTKRIASLDW